MAAVTVDSEDLVDRSFDGQAFGKVLASIDPPSSFLCYDIECLGYHHKSFIVEVGHLFVDSWSEGASFSQPLDWSMYSQEVVDKFHYFLDKTRNSIKEKDANHPLCDLMRIRYLVENGMPAKRVLAAEAKVITSAQNNGWWLCGTNLAFDERVTAGNLAEYLGEEGFGFDWNKVIDVGLLYKAALIKTVKQPGETLGGFYRRVRNKRVRIKWGLETIVASLGLELKLEHHRALNDCRISLEVFRAMTQAASLAPVPLPPREEFRMRRSVRHVKGVL